MRMKEDQGETKVRTGNGQLKPAYNVQTGTEGGFVAGYDLFPNPGDTLTMKRHLERQQERLGVRPKAVIADAGYGSGENYQYREDNGTVAVVKYGTYRKERTKKGKEDRWKTGNREYHKEEKYYGCSQGRRLTCRETKQERTGNGYPITIDRYEGETCENCPDRALCTKGKGNRSIERNENLRRLKAQARSVLKDEAYGELKKQRSVEVETVFGQLKGNQGYRRFLLRGMEKVAAEWGLLSLGYHVKRLYRAMGKKAG